MTPEAYQEVYVEDVLGGEDKGLGLSTFGLEAEAGAQAGLRLGPGRPGIGVRAGLNALHFLGTNDGLGGGFVGSVELGLVAGSAF